jgi:hypothetical protein
MVDSMTAYCAVKISVPMIYWSKDKELLRWAIFTRCGKTIHIDKVRGTKHPLEVPCCGSHPLDPNKINYSLKEITEVTNIVSPVQKEPVECNVDMTNKQVTEIVETPLAKDFSWPDTPELSRLVNSQSMRSLAKQLNTSIGSIKKQCAKLNIEIPKARFNWSKT